jgi:hypothetical protein
LSLIRVQQPFYILKECCFSTKGGLVLLQIKHKLLFVIPVLILAVAVGFAAQNYPTGVRELQTCVNVSYTEEVAVEQTCTSEHLEFWCDPSDLLNLSCSWQNRSYTFTCINRTLVPTTKQECSTTGFLVNNKVKLDTNLYRCSGEVVGSKTIMTCDSRFDGNGDGVCTSGESCMQFTIDGTTVTTKEKNSRDDFVADDDSYYAKEATAEVLP